MIPPASMLVGEIGGSVEARTYPNQGPTLFGFISKTNRHGVGYPGGLVDYYAVWPSVVSLVLVYAAAATPLFKPADTPPSPVPSRVSTLDGLRGFLALAVFYHHGAVYHDFVKTGIWRLPPSRIFMLLGPTAVSMFFMITGFLFWVKIVASRGRVAWFNLLIGRVFRIGPLYLVAISLMIAGTLIGLHFRISGSIPKVALEIAEWLPFGALSAGKISNFNSQLLLAGVTWSLKYEWLFYFSLPVSAIFARRSLISIIFPAAGFIATLSYIILLHQKGFVSRDAPFAALFFGGMLAASIKANEVIPVLPDKFGSPLAALLIVILLITTREPYSAPTVLIEFCIFYLIANGASLGGILTSRAAIRLGDMSFGIYLLQGLVLAAVFSCGAVKDFSLGGPLRHWTIISGVSLVLIGVAALAHVLIERPGISLGRRISNYLGSGPIKGVLGRAVI